jgi:CRP-like cAMP-binding protein
VLPPGKMGGAVESATRKMAQPIRSRLFEGLNTEEIAAVVHAAKTERFAAHSVIFDQTHMAERMFLLTHGQARYFFITHAGRRILLPWLMPGDIAGARSVLSQPMHYHVSLEVLKDSRFLVWDRRTLRHLTISYPKFLRNALFIADIYLGWFLTAHIALTCFSARQRCASVLKSIALTIGQTVEEGIEVEITNEELADASATTLFEASRFLGDWRRSGAIFKKRGKILVRSMTLLTREIRNRA